eukprot:scaffold13654_cov150-Skeletonema_dohrnii-CCMP3373.AAC.1
MPSRKKAQGKARKAAKADKAKDAASVPPKPKFFDFGRYLLVNSTEKGGNPEAHGKNMPRSFGKNETGIQKRTVRTGSKSTHPSAINSPSYKNSSDYDGY